MPDVKLSPEATDILKRSTITQDSVTLPQQMERKLYEEVDKALRNAGGKWNRAKRAHVFQCDPRELLAEALSNGKSIDQRKKFQAFDTPPEVVRRVIQMADIERGMLVLEPSAGTGILARWAREAGGVVDCVEINDVRFGELLPQGFREVILNDFLTINPFDQYDLRSYDRIVMNPPFTKKQDIRHVLHALKFLKPGGRLVAIVQQNHVTELSLSVHPRNHVIHSEDIEAGAFKESGTGIATAMVVIE